MSTNSIVQLPSGVSLSVCKEEAASGSPSGSPIVFIHGPGHFKDVYLPLFPYLSTRTRIAYDQPGHGESTMPKFSNEQDDLKPAFFASVIDEMLDAIGIGKSEPITLVGHGGGGLVAL